MDNLALFESIKKDNVKEFSSYINEDVFSYAFGRFPILSVCYLFGARKIAKKYFDNFIKVRNYIEQPSINEIEVEFIKRAGKTLRLFSVRKVEPLEMLAVLGERDSLKKAYRIHPRQDMHKELLSQIYYIRTQKQVRYIGKDIDLPKESLSFRAVRLLRIAGVSFLAFAVCVSAVLIGTNLGIGIGTKSNPLKVRNANQCDDYFSSDMVLSLTKDISLQETVQDINADIQGDNHTIILKNTFANEFSGSIKDVTIIVGADFEGDSIIGTNRGRIENVKIVVEKAEFLKKSEYQSIFVQTNDTVGVIKNCEVVYNATLFGDSAGDCYFGAFVGENKGKILDCVSCGEIKSALADLGGIAGKNDYGAEISNCTNDIALEQNVTINSWSPNCGGIAIVNEGTISKCKNQAKIVSVLNVEEPNSDHLTTSYVGGIVCMNYGNITSCENVEEITSKATNGIVFAGGICSWNNSTHITVDEQEKDLYGQVSLSISSGKVEGISNVYNPFVGGIAGRNETGCSLKNVSQNADVNASCTDEETRYVFVGGVTGYNGGYVERATFVGELPKNSNTICAGAITGFTEFKQNIYGIVYVEVYNCAYVTTENVKFANGATLLYQMGVQYVFTSSVLEEQATYYSNYLQSGTTAVESVDALHEWEDSLQ